MGEPLICHQLVSKSVVANNNQLYDLTEDLVLPAFVVAILSMAGFFTASLTIGDWSLALDSTLSLGGYSVGYDALAAFAAFGAAGGLHELWAWIDDGFDTSDVDRLIIAAEAGLLGLFPFVSEYQTLVVDNLWAAGLFVLVSLAAVYYIDWAR